MQTARVSVGTLEQFRRIALKAKIRYVYIGNGPGHEANLTYCHQCGRRIVVRTGYTIPDYHLVGNRCRFCNTRIPGCLDRLVCNCGITAIKYMPSPIERLQNCAQIYPAANP